MTKALAGGPLHTQPACLPLNVGVRGGVAWIMTDNLQIMTQLYHNPLTIRNFFCSPRPTEVYTHTFPLLHADPAVLWR